MGGRRRRRRVEPTEDWGHLKLLCGWPEQVEYEEIRPLVLFGSSAAERAEQTGTAERTLYRKAGRFETEGMESLFASQAARRRRLPPSIRRLIVDLKAEYPPFSLNERSRRSATRASAGRPAATRSRRSSGRNRRRCG